MTSPDPAKYFSRSLARDFIEFANSAVLDLVIVGSGYGAAMAATTFAGGTNEKGEPLRIVLLERGREMLPGAFPSTLDELPGHVRLSRAGHLPIGRRDALFDVRLAGDVNALVANGLGGGSLINGGVMVEPEWGDFDSRLPREVEQDLQAKWMEPARRMLGARQRDSAGNWRDNTIDRHLAVQSDGVLKKTAALQWLAAAHPERKVPGMRHEPAPITVRLNLEDNIGQSSALKACSLCGDCLTGCNVGAKISLDTNLLLDAQQRDLQIYTSASVLRLERRSGVWALEVVHTDPQVQGRRSEPVTIRAHKVVLAAGSLGSTEILLRSQEARGPSRLQLSPRLGEQFSLNGDNTATVRFDRPVNALANEAEPLISDTGVSPRRIGPEITHMLRWRSDAGGPGFLVQEFSVPAPLRGFFEEIVTTRGWLSRLADADSTCHAAPFEGERDPLALNREALQRELMVGLIGHDSAQGRIELPPHSTCEGAVKVHWPGVAHDPAMADAFGKLEQRVSEVLGASAHITPNPVWRLLPKALGDVVGASSGGALTVHPLGGCPMGETPATGAVSPLQAVFNLDTSGSDPWEGSLLVLDGAVVPASLGANPALTIAALSLRASHHWLKAWDWTSGQAQSSTPPAERPRARAVSDCLPPQAPAPTRVQIIERLWGRVDWLDGPHGREVRWVELTFAFEPASTEELTQTLRKRLPLSQATFDGDTRVNRLRIYRSRDLEGRSLDALSEQERECIAEVRASLRGHMDLLERGPSLAVVRQLRAFAAFVRNRGLQDLMRFLRDRSPRDKDHPGWMRGIARALKMAWRLASQAGEVRRFDYRAQVSGTAESRDPTPSVQDFWNKALMGAHIQGHKRFTYARGENPWNQLLYLNLQRLGRSLLPGWWWPWRRSFPLKLDARFLAGQGLPLMRITEQANQVRALSDLTHLGLYWARIFAKLQLWQLSQPDPPPGATPQRLPGAVKGLPAPEIMEIDLEPSHARMEAERASHIPRAVVRLTRYRALSPACAQSPLPPLVFIHGYSASGTSFAHSAMGHPAALHFWRTGRDIWVLDLRTSAGMPTASLPWAFEDAAWADIPVAMDHIARQVADERGTPGVQLDVFAHCIGAVMLSMALLVKPQHLIPEPGQPKRYPDELARLPATLRKVVLSQKGFYVDYTDANILRAYLLTYFKAALQGGYSFRPSTSPRQGEAVFDAFLNTLPYPPHTWSLDNPWFSRTPWSATRRRMDALYERTFNIERMSRPVLERIDDFFGPLNLETVAQVIHLARNRELALKNGQILSLDHMPIWPRAGTLLLGSTENGMVSPLSSQRMAEVFRKEGIAHQLEIVPGGHQDILIGRGAERLWKKVEAFFNA